MANNKLIEVLRNENPNTAYGMRYGSNKYKQQGYFGEIPIGGGDVATEYSVSQNINGKDVEMPTIVPSLTYDELEAVKNSAKYGTDIPDEIYRKAALHAQMRMSQNKSPFWAIPEKQYPQPQRPVNAIVDLLRK